MRNDPDQEIACGFVALVGPPNAGKSTLLNRLLGQKISIVTPKPQTTRNRVLGVANGPGYQLILLDTPGLHRARNPLNSEMVKIARNTVKEVDAVAYMIDAGSPDGEHRREAAELLRGAGKPALLLCNKIDRIGKEKLLPLISAWQEVYPFQAIIPISAMNGEGCEIFLDQASRLLPMGPKLFPDDLPTDASERFICGEIIREKIMLLTKDELPYSVAVVIESFSEEPERNLTTIHATIMVEKDSQKGIIIGSKGSMLQRIGQTARREIEALLGVKVLLKLWVKVQKNWTANRRVLQELGF
ncbi:MAG TPA: GTPase Era [Desulfurivibrio alkaliphilus]|uniref:GTPase Era n=1 Tax=Desulfurivibrio alkaliphilus TaxID=427923 RepID=A0A7C2XH97_9BACT|nr:GTPase Era [Desulfurivibrio alkaliphilus]